MADGFLSRWSRRKQEVREGKPVPQEPAAPPQPVDTPADRAAPVHAVPGAAAASEAGSALPRAAEAPPEQPPPTLDDARALRPDDDFRRFVSPEVPPDVKNTALKKLFSDPHFNTMDGMDVYVDDYSKPDPIPPAMLRQLAAAKFLDLFDEEKDRRKKEQEDAAREEAAREVPGQGREVADAPGDRSVAQSPEAEQAVPPTQDHADPDLRLQQDDAARPPGAGGGDP